jgi:phage baseplate assembly protein W
MTDSTGTNARTGAPLSDWEHTEQSIQRVLTTPLGSVVMWRDYGSQLFDLVDAKMIQRNVLALYVAAADALAKWEPRFQLAYANVTQLTPDGMVGLNLYGTYYPRGHLGDYSIAEDASTRVVLQSGAT